MPTTDAGKTIAARNATTHGLFSRGVVLPALGEAPEGYKQLESQWMQQLPPRTFLERHYVEKIAAASWRLRRLHRWQAQILENDALTEDEQLDKLAKVLRHETTLHRQIDTSVKMLNKDAPQLFAQRALETVLADTRTARREYESCEEDAVHVELKVQDHLYRVQKATEEAALSLADAPLDPTPECTSNEVGENELPPQENCQNELPPQEAAATEETAGILFPNVRLTCPKRFGFCVQGKLCVREEPPEGRTEEGQARGPAPTAPSEPVGANPRVRPHYLVRPFLCSR